MSEEKNILRKIGDGIVDIAPTIGALLTGSVIGAPAGAAVNALGALGKAFGLGSTATPTAIATAILSDPEARLKVMQADNAFKLAVMADEQETLRLQLSDVQGARTADVEKTKIIGKRDTNLYALAWLFVAGFFITIIAMVILTLTDTLPEDMPKEIIFLLGSLFQCLTMGVNVVLQYFFGPVKGALKKRHYWPRRKR